jgi:hypothetical protein
VVPLVVPAVWVGGVADAPVAVFAKMNPAVLKVAVQVLAVEQVLPMQQVRALAPGTDSLDRVSVAVPPSTAVG